MKIPSWLIPTALLAIAACNQAPEKKATPVTATSDTTTSQTAGPNPAEPRPYIHPPLDSVDVPYKEYTIDAANGDTLSYPTGTTILFPPGAFVDKAGNSVQGKIKVRYREFAGPIDFYLAGIPMTYDSAGKNYLFSSSGMCEILADKEGTPVYVNPKSKPRINLAVRGSAANANLYYLDTTRHNWVYKEAGHPATAIRQNKLRLLPNVPAESMPVKPVRPEKEDDKSPVIRLIIDTSAFGELKAYNNLRFQLEAGGRRFNPKDTSETWSNVVLKRAKDSNSYIVTFSNPSRSVSYAARPVLDEKDFPAAMQAFERQTAVYNESLRQREEYYKSMERTGINSTTLMRGFSIDGFGYWNCDYRFFSATYAFHAHFIDNNTGRDIKVSNIAVLYPSANGYTQFESDNIAVGKNLDFAIAGTWFDRFVFIPVSRCKQVHIDDDTKYVTFPMTIVPKKDYRRIVEAAKGWSAQ